MYKTLVLLLLVLLSANSFAEDPHPKAPTGWVEMNSIDPVILTWVKADSTKKLEEVPSAMVQKFPRTDKFVNYVKEKSLDAKGCRTQTVNGWNQVWCLRPDSVLAILYRGEAGTLPELLKKWVLTHD